MHPRSIIRKAIVLTTVSLVAVVAAAANLSFTEAVADPDSTTVLPKVPLFRAQGYRGSVSISNMGIIWTGFDTSHGYMFNEHHYLGAGVGMMICPIDRPLAFFFHIYADYNAYWFDRKSTPTAGIRIGYIRSSDRGNLSALELEPSIGWSWGTKSGYGLALCLGLDIITIPVNFTETSSLPFTAFPKLNFAFEF